jgi:hypothetical protein
VCSPRYRRYFLNFIMDYERQKRHGEPKLEPLKPPAMRILHMPIQILYKML